MAVFTAIGAAVASALTLTGTFATIAGISLSFAGTLVAGVVAAGLGFATSKLLGVFDVPTVGVGTTPVNGSKVQVAPSTDNKIGVAFGKNFMSGPITDVAISNQNQTMHYCILLSEYIEGATYSVEDIYWGDAILQFNQHIATGYIDPNATTNQDWNGKIRIRIYAGGTQSGDQVFPSGGGVFQVAATTMMPHWTDTTNYSMDGLVFAMVEVDYDAENGLTGLGQMTFEIENDITNPGDVLIRYLNNDRWGCGLSNSLIDVPSITGTANTSMKGFCDELVSYTNIANVTANIARYEINGYLSTFDTNMENIDKICQNSGTFFAFDGKQGKFKTIPNRELSSNELANAFVLNDDNIVSKISVSSTELYNMFNQVEVSFADRNRKDQTNTVFLETPSGDRNPNEPDNPLEFRAELINNNIHAELLGNIELNQSRNGMVCQLTGDYSTLQIDAGDVVKLNNTDFGFNNKLFKVMRSKEKLTESSMITCEMTLLEYTDTNYVAPTITESAKKTPQDNPTDILDIRDHPVYLPTNSLQNKMFGKPQTYTSGSGTGARFIIRTDPTTETYANVTINPAYPGSGYANADTVEISGKFLGGREPENNLSFQVAGVGAGGELSKTLNGIQNITGNAVVVNEAAYSGSIDRFALKQYSAGGQVDFAPATNVNLTSNTAVFREIAPRVPVDLANIENGTYTVLTNSSPLGQTPATGVADYGFRFGIDVNFANGHTITNYVSTGQTYTNFDSIPTVINAQGEFAVTDEMLDAEIKMEGYNTLANIGGTPNTVGFKNLKYDMFKVNKGDIK